MFTFAHSEAFSNQNVMTFTESESCYFLVSLTRAFQFIYLVIGKPNLLGQVFMNYVYTRLCSLLKETVLSLLTPSPKL